MIGIVGTGMMASGLIVLCSGHGYDTVVLARSDESEARCRKTVDGYYDQMVGHGLLTKAQKALCLEHIAYVRSYAGMAEAETVFECVVERLDVKREVYAAVEAN